MTSSEYVPGLAGVPAARSSISYIDGNAGLLEYRGIRVEELARESSYEEVAYLLLFGSLPKKDDLDAFAARLANARRIPEGMQRMIAAFPRDGHPMAALQTAVSALAMYDGGRDYAERATRLECAVELTAQFPTIVGAFQRAREGKEPLEPDPSLSHAADFLRMTTGDVPDAIGTRIMDAALIVHADHTMNASTFAARVTASTISSPFAVLAAAVGSLAGPLHGGANERVLLQLQKIGDKARVRPVIEDMIARKQKIMGLGHRVYKTKDPRAIILQELAVQLFETKGRSEVYDVALEVEEVAKELLSEKGIYPNVDFYSGMIYEKLGIPTDVFTPIFAVARSAGWLAHWLEQMEDNRLFRPRQIYEGERERGYVPIDER